MDLRSPVPVDHERTDYQAVVATVTRNQHHQDGGLWCALPRTYAFQQTIRYGAAKLVRERSGARRAA